MRQAKMDGFTLHLDDQGKVLWVTHPGCTWMYIYVKNRQGFWQIAQDLTVSQVRGRYRRGTLKIW